MKKFFYVNERSGRKFEIVDVSQEEGTITLKGDLSTFTETWDKARFKELGYKRVVEEVEEEDAPT